MFFTDIHDGSPVEVFTPYPELGGDPTHYDPDYRAKIASALGTSVKKSDLPADLLSNRAFIKHAKFMSEFRDEDNDAMATYRRYPENGLVLNWAICNNNSQTKYYLDSLLLTDQPIEVIAADLGVKPEIVSLYEQLYFSCRDRKTREMRLAARTKTAFALGPLLELPRNAPSQIQWRLAGAHLGYAGLVYRWGWENDAHGEYSDFTSMRRNMWLASMQVEQRLRSGQFSNDELFGVISGCIEYERMLIEKETKGESLQQGMDLVQNMLRAVAPKLIDVAATQDQLDADEKAAYNKMLAESNFSQTEYDDKGAIAFWETMQGDLQLSQRLKGHNT